MAMYTIEVKPASGSGGFGFWTGVALFVAGASAKPLYEWGKSKLKKKPAKRGSKK